MKTNNKIPNKLIKEKSPYLLQHSYNPVNWYPWGEEAFEKARSEDKPVFLSIGYSTCHWCHVMERESFEDNEVADYLNQNYVSIKVDREERPDIDQIYMEVCQALTGQGGWPLTIFMTPEQKPFYAGTYFPKEGKWGRTGLLDILAQINEAWRKDRANIIEVSEKITSAVKEKEKTQLSKAELSTETFQKANEQLHQAFDEDYGGFGYEPKFPTPHNYLFLLREWARTKDNKLLDIVSFSLKKMYQGGIYDHLGGGFSRYSVDRKWLVPHFEKMLYDNALLAYALIETYQAAKDEFYSKAAEEIFNYIKRDMTAPGGGFYSAEDADSEGEEGKFYIWSQTEIQNILGKEEAELFCDIYGVTKKGNFEGKNILNMRKDLETIASEKGIAFVKLKQQLDTSKYKLFSEREKRVHPHKDDKILTSWNGLMIASLAKGAAALQKPEYLEMAKNAAEFIESKLINQNGRLLARYRDGHANFLGYLDDYAFYIWGLQELFQASGDPEYLEKSARLLEDTIKIFWDRKNFGFYFYGSDSETLLTRPREVYDGAIPSGNSVMLLNLIRHTQLTGAIEIETYTEKLVDAFSKEISKHPTGYTFFLSALQMLFGTSMEIVIVEGDNHTEFEGMKNIVHTEFLPFASILLKRNKYMDKLDQLSSAHKDKAPVNGKSAFYLCENFTCQKPVLSKNEITFP